MTNYVIHIRVANNGNQTFGLMTAETSSELLSVDPSDYMFGKDGRVDTYLSWAAAYQACAETEGYLLDVVAV